MLSSLNDNLLNRKRFFFTFSLTFLPGETLEKT